MGSSPTPPAVTDPNVTANNQQALNTTAGQQSQAGSMVNQTNPYGSLTYTQTGTNANGTPMYTANQQLSAAQQGLLNTQQQGQQTAGTQAGSLLTGANYGSVPAADAIGNATSGLTGQAMQQEVSYLQPYFTQQTNQLDTKLKNQGFNPGDPAYDNAMRAQQNNQGNTVTGFEASIEPQMYQQAQSTYTLPAQLAESLGGYATPGSVNQNLTQTPQLNIQPANLIGATSNAQTAQQATYQDQLNQNNAMMGGLFGIGSSVLGGMAKSGGMSSLLGALAL